MGTSTIRAKVIAGNTKFMEASTRKDAPGLARLYTKGGNSSRPPVRA